MGCEVCKPVLLADLGNPDARLRPFETVSKVLKDMSPQDVVGAIVESGLRGRGGAGFPTGVKWQIVAAEDSEEKYIVANGAEGEPGCFKDRLLMRELPHQLVAGMIIAAYAVGASKGYVYIHHEAQDCMDAVQGAIDDARRLGCLGGNVGGIGFSFDLQVHVAGIGYVAGEETAVLQFIEGKPPKPRAKPPYPTTHGLWGKPTLVNNIETLSNVLVIMRDGVEFFKSLGTPDTTGTILVSLNGVKKPGVYEVPAGVTLRDVIYKCGGGPLGKIRGVIPGGYASAFLSPDDLDVTLEFGAMKTKGSHLGAANIHVFDESQCMVEATRKFMRFFAAETCGQCFPCRKGTRDFLQMTLEVERCQAPADWESGIKAVFDLTGRKTICGLDKAAGGVMRSAMKLFADEFHEHIKHSNCCHVCNGNSGEMPDVKEARG